jgi:UDP-N-acetylmuramyl pentapeptide phosphotransferase/UDP-N-acetylglucosamine-1-phosphate transferase
MELEKNLIFLITFSLVSLVVAFLTARYSKFFFSGSLLDNDFLKPQAFHKEPAARIGGLLILFLFVFFLLIYFYQSGILLKDYFTISLLLFFIGFLDDLKIRINPVIRLFLMIISLLACINIFSIQINISGLSILDFWLTNNLFQICFVLLSFLFIINGANLIDGFNGLLTIHFLIINSVFLVIEMSNSNQSMLIILIIQTIIATSFLLFNFPKAKIFLGDSGSYILGGLICLNTINVYKNNPDITPFFFSGILFYLFFEVFFSFIRKAYSKLSPVRPDKNHMHMLLYKYIVSFQISKDSNYLTSIMLNCVYLIFILPIILLKQNTIFCRYYFFFLIIIYVISYFKLKKLTT